MKYCEKCGNPLMDGDLFCGNCGNRVMPEEQSASGAKNDENNYFNPYANDYDDFEVQAKPDESEVNEPVGAQDNMPPTQSPVQHPAQPSENRENGAIPESSNMKNKNTISIGIDLKKAKVPLIIAGVLIVLLIVASIVAGIISNKIKNAPIEINLSDYISDTFYIRSEFENLLNNANGDYPEDADYRDYDDYSDNSFYRNYYTPGLLVDGYNGYAHIYSGDLPNVIHWDILTEYVDENLAQKSDGKNTLHYYDVLSPDFFTFSVDKSDGISNGDTVTVTVAGSSETLTVGSVQINIVPATKEYMIDQLETVPVINPFDYISCATYGPNGYASASYLIDPNLNEKIDDLEGFSVTRYSEDEIAIEKDGYIVNKIRFYNESNSNYSNGDKVKIYCESEVYDFEIEYNVYIAQYEKEYTISGLGEYLTSTDMLGKDDISAFISDSKSAVREKISSDSRSDFAYHSTYFIDTKDKTSMNSNIDRNGICVIYSYVYEDWNGDKKVSYAYVQYSNVIVSDGKLFGSAQNYYNYYDYGFDSADEIIDRLSDGGYYIVNQIN